MKKALRLLSLAVLTVGLLGSCAKIDERINSLDKRANDIENNRIASVEKQIAAIEASIADLETIRVEIKTLMETKPVQGDDVATLRAADQILERKIDDLKAYVDAELAKYASTEWANATFATLEKQAEILADITKLKTDLAGVDAKLDAAIANLDSSLKGWVNEQLSAYYTAAQMDAKVKALQDEIDALKTGSEADKTKIEGLETKLNGLTRDLEATKATIKTEYEAAIAQAINENNGIITRTIQVRINEVNAAISALTGRVEALETTVGVLTGRIDALEAMIQKVTIVPAYGDGSVKTEDGVLELNLIVSPVKAAKGLTKENVKILTNSVLTKAVSIDTVKTGNILSFVVDETKGTMEIKADISDKLPSDASRTLTVAVNVGNGISDFTTEFVKVTCPDIPEGFVDLGVKNAEGKPLYWAKCNLGASKPEDYGYYYFWAGTTGYIHDVSKWVNAKTSEELSGGFCDTNTPYCVAYSYTKYTVSDSKTVLEPEDDAATKANSSWRTPTIDEFAALLGNCVCICCDGTIEKYKGTTVVGYIVYKAKNDGDKGKVRIIRPSGEIIWGKWDGSSYIDGSAATGTYSASDTHIFFPAAGSGRETTLDRTGSLGSYWSSSNFTVADILVYIFEFGYDNIGEINPVLACGVRPFGNPVRPVSD